MHTSRMRALAAGSVGLILGLSTLGSAPAEPAAPGGDNPSATTAGTAGSARTVTLPTGDRVSVTTDAAGHVLATPATAKPYVLARMDGDDYAIPIGRGPVDPSRFDLSTLTSVGQPATVRPDYPMRTLTLNAVDVDGQPADSVSISVVNVDDSRKYSGFPQVTNGHVQVSVPDGHYAAMATFNEFGTGGLVGERIVFTDFTVAGVPATATLDARSATNQVNVAAPAGTTLLGQDVTWYRGSSDDYGGITGLVGLGPDVSVWLNTSAATIGAQHFYLHDRFESDQSVYDVEFPTDGAIGPDPRYTVDPASLATVDTRYYSDTAGRVGTTLWFGLMPWEFFQVRTNYPVTAPVRRTEYLTGDERIAYSGFLATTRDAAAESWQSGYRHYAAGEHAEMSWLRGPLAPGMPTDTGVSAYECRACRVDDTLSILLAPLTDADPDHYGALAASGDGIESGSRFRLYQGDTLLADLTDQVGGDFAVPPDDAAYRVVYDETRHSTATAQSTSSHTEWTFRSRHSGATTVPDRWYCGLTAVTTDCSAVSLLTVGYQLSQGLDGRTPAGPQTLLLTVGHTPGADPVPVRHASVEVSYDAGATWQSVPTTATGEDGGYAAAWDATTSGATVSLRVSADDAAGNTVTQTVLNAVTVE